MGIGGCRLDGGMSVNKRKITLKTDFRIKNGEKQHQITSVVTLFVIFVKMIL